MRIVILFFKIFSCAGISSLFLLQGPCLSPWCIFQLLNRMIRYQCPQTVNQEPQSNTSIKCVNYACIFLVIFHPCLSVGKKGRGQEQFILALNPAATWGLTEIRQNWSEKLFSTTIDSCSVRKIKKKLLNILFHYQSLFLLDLTPGLHRFPRQPLWEELWLVEPLESFLTSELNTSASKAW